MTKWRMAWQNTHYWAWHRFVCSGENKTAQAGVLYGHLQVLLFFAQIRNDFCFCFLAMYFYYILFTV